MAAPQPVAAAVRSLLLPLLLTCCQPPAVGAVLTPAFRIEQTDETFQLFLQEDLLVSRLL